MTTEVRRIQELPRLSPRRSDAHKGSFGHVLVVGGSRPMPGAVSLACNAALRGGAGLVTFAVPEDIQLTIAGLCPCATSVPLDLADGQLTGQAVRQLVETIKQCDVVAIGPGMGVGSGQMNLVRAALEEGKPLVIDADGLNNLRAIEGWPALRRSPTVLTPHPGELSRLTGWSIGQIQADREIAALEAARGWNEQCQAKDAPLIVVLKGAGTVVTDGRQIYINDTGNPGMATGGSGDVLTGLTAAILGQGMGAFGAACLAVNCHGRAGDLAAQEIGQVSMTASDILDFLPKAIREVS